MTRLNIVNLVSVIITLIALICVFAVDKEYQMVAAVVFAVAGISAVLSDERDV